MPPVDGSIMAMLRTFAAPFAGAVLASLLLGGAMANAATAPERGQDPAAAHPRRASAPAIVLPPVNGSFDYQIGGGYPPLVGTRIVTRDISQKPAPHTYGICYINAFQAQTAARHWWLTKHPNLVLRDSHGRPVVDKGWNEMLLDTSTQAKRRGLLRIESRWLGRCSTKGYRGVEPDNLDSWTRSHHLLTMRENAMFAAALVRAGHARGLAIAQKNDTDMLALHSLTRFDFAVAEECQVYSECNQYMGTYGRHLIEIEYPDNGGLANFQAACDARGSQISIAYRDRDVRPRGAAGYVYRRC